MALCIHLVLNLLNHLLGRNHHYQLIQQKHIHLVHVLIYIDIFCCQFITIKYFFIQPFIWIFWVRINQFKIVILRLNRMAVKNEISLFFYFSNKYFNIVISRRILSFLIYCFKNKNGRKLFARRVFCAGVV